MGDALPARVAVMQRNETMAILWADVMALPLGWIHIVVNGNSVATLRRARGRRNSRRNAKGPARGRLVLG